MIKIIQGDITTLAVDAIVNAANDSITFPYISTGIYGYPKDAAAQIAVRETEAFLKTHDIEVVFCCFSSGDKKVYEKLAEGKQ